MKALADALEGLGALRALPRLRGRGKARTRRLALPALTPRLRRRLLALVAVLLLLAAGYQFWLRDSSLVAVEDVTVTGLTTEDAERVRIALTSAGHSMTTLRLERQTLDRAVAHFPVVRDLEVRSDFPHGLTIHVIEHHPAALVDVGGERVPVAGDGTLLRGLPVEGRLPSIDAGDGVSEERLRDPDALGAALVAGAIPGPLRKRVESVGTGGDDGLVVELSEGPELIFGDASRVRAKWIAAARVLADPDAAGATYIDLRQPDRPAAGGLPGATVDPVAPAGAASATVPAIPQASGAADPAATTPPTTGVAPASDPTAVALPDPGAAPVATPEPVPQAPAAGTPGAVPTDAGGAGIPAG